MMRRFLQTLYEYRCLMAKDELGIPLDKEEAARCRECFANLSETTHDRRRMSSRWPMALLIQVTVPGAFFEAQLKNLSAGGLALHTTGRTSVGENVFVHLDVSGVDYMFPGKVSWRRGDLLGVTFVGVPSRRRVSGFFEKAPSAQSHVL